MAVVTSLLSVGEAVLTEARDKDLLGGGDVILLPVGIDVESLKVGGATSLFYKIPGFRFLLRSVLESPRVAPFLGEVSPRFAGEQLYLRAHGRVTPVIGLGTVPSRERAVLPGYSWPDSIRDTEADRRLISPTAEERLCDTDHFHAPPPSAAELGWAEWHYFEIYDPATTRFAYLSFQVFGDWAHGKGIGAVAVQLGRAGKTSGRALHGVPGAEVRASLTRPDLEIGDTRIRLEGSEYHVQFHDGPVSGDIRFAPELHQSFAAGELRGDSGFVSGYAVAFLKGRARGEMRSPQGGWKFDQAVGYHDHNWGGWKSVSWNWGKAAGDSLSLLYGQVQAGASRQPGFAALFSPQGLLGIFRPESVEVRYDGLRTRKVPGGEAPLPRSVHLAAAAGERDSLIADIVIQDGVATPIPENRDFRPHSLLAARRAFLQMRGNYHVRAMLDADRMDMRSPGPAETYAPIHRQGRSSASGN